MGVFDNIKSRLSKWIQVEDDQNTLTIEDFSYKTGVEGLIKLKHCEKCVSVNKCWFVNSKDKKPDANDLTGVEVIDNFLHDITPGLYHYKCHCSENPILSPTIHDISLIIDQGKIEWLVQSKYQWIESMGYAKHVDIVPIIMDAVKLAYCNGDYEINKHDKYGFRINLFITIPGKGVKVNRFYNLKSGFTIFPSGKLKCNTLIGGWVK